MIDIARVSVEPRFYQTLIDIGINVTYYRKKKNLTQEELAEKIDVSRKTMSNIENQDKVYGMSLNTLLKISEVLEIPIKSLFDFRDEN